MTFQNVDTFFFSNFNTKPCFFNYCNEIIIIMQMRLLFYLTGVETEYLSQRRNMVRIISIYRHIHQLSAM